MLLSTRPQPSFDPVLAASHVSRRHISHRQIGFSSLQSYQYLLSSDWLPVLLTTQSSHPGDRVRVSLNTVLLQNKTVCFSYKYVLNNIVLIIPKKPHDFLHLTYDDVAHKDINCMNKPTELLKTYILVFRAHVVPYLRVFLQLCFCNVRHVTL